MKRAALEKNMHVLQRNEFTTAQQKWENPNQNPTAFTRLEQGNTQLLGFSTTVIVHTGRAPPGTLLTDIVLTAS